MQAIHTRFIPATATKPARVKAYTLNHGQSATIMHVDHGVAAHFPAVLALVEKCGLSWDTRQMRYGPSCDGRGYTFCFAASIVGEV
jgi:hypothetical protein